MHRRVVITGVGPVCAGGIGIDAFWASMCSGASSISPIRSFDAAALGMAIGGEVDGLKIRDLVPKSYRKATKVMARDIELAVAAAKLAAEDAGLVTRGSEDGSNGFAIDSARTGCHIGAGQISADPAELGRALSVSMGDDGIFDTQKWGTEGDGAGAMNNLPPLWLLKYLPNMLACHVTIIHGLEGPSNTIMGAEAGALQSIGESMRVIERGSADLCFTGGAESRVNPMGLARMRFAGRASDVDAHADGGTVLKPFDSSSRGVIGEGGGMLVVEDASHASERGASVYAELAGFGCGMDTKPMTPGLAGVGDASQDRGLTGAIKRAMKDADVSAEDIDAIVPMAAGEPALDCRELGSLRAAMGDVSGQPMITVSPVAGNMLAGHGGLTTAVGAMAIREQKLPARVHGGSPDGAIAGRSESVPAVLRNVLVCAGSYGGQAAALVLRRAD